MRAAMLLLVVFFAACKPVEHVPPAKRLNLNCSAEEQAKRKELIDKFIAQNIFTKVTAGQLVPKVWTGPAFAALDFDVKQQFVSVVFAYYACGEQPEVTVVKLLNSKTGNAVGTYDDMFGLQLN